MTFDEFEVYVRREIENFLNGTNTRSGKFTYNEMVSLRLRWRNDNDTALIQFNITVETDINAVQFSLEIMNDDPDSTPNYYTRGETTLPKTPEEYFQLSTIQELGFRWEFYEYLNDTINKIK